jgi:hypothetical protein
MICSVDCARKIDRIVLAISWAIASTITALVFMPKFREMNFTSAYEVPGSIST